MTNILRAYVLKYSIPSLAVLIIILQLFFVRTYKLSQWKGGGYGMYSEIHYLDNKIHIPGMSVDSLQKNKELKVALYYLRLMPNRDNLEASARLILELTEKDSVHVQIWKPNVNSKKGTYYSVLTDEIHLKK